MAKENVLSMWERIKAEAYAFAKGVVYGEATPFGWGTWLEDNKGFITRIGVGANNKSDVMRQSEVRGFVADGFNSLTWVNKMTALGWGDDQEAREDRARLAVWGLLGDRQKEAMDIVETKRLVRNRLKKDGGPSYWSEEDKEETGNWFEFATDRLASEAMHSSKYEEMKEKLELLGVSADLTRSFCKAERRWRAGELSKEERDELQEALLSTAKTLNERPSLKSSVLRIASVSSAALALTVAGVSGSGIVPGGAEILKAMGVSGMAVGALGFTVKTSDFFATYRGNGFAEDSYARAYEGSENKEKIAEAVDWNICTSYRNLGTANFSKDEQARYLRAMGAVRSILAGIAPQDNEEARVVSRIPKEELPLLARLTHPALASVFLLEAVSTKERLNTIDLQAKINWAGFSKNRFMLDEDDAREARLHLRKRELLSNGDKTLGLTESAIVAESSEMLSKVKGKLSGALADLCPAGVKGEFSAALIHQDKFDVATIVRTLDEATDRELSKLDQKGGITKWLGERADKISRSLIKDPIRLLNGLKEWFVDKLRNDAESFDYAEAKGILVRESGGVHMKWDDENASDWQMKRDSAQTRHEGQAILGMIGEGHWGERISERLLRKVAVATSLVRPSSLSS